MRSFNYRSNAITKAREGLLNLSDFDLYVIPVDTKCYAPDWNHRILSKIPNKARCGQPVQLQDVTWENRILDASNIVLTDVDWGCDLGLVIYLDGAREKELLAFINTDVYTTGGTIHVNWDEGRNKIFSLLKAAPSPEQLQ